MARRSEICRVCFERVHWHQTEEVNVDSLRKIVKITQLTSLGYPNLSSLKGHSICDTCLTNLNSLTTLHDLVSKSNLKVNTLMSQKHMKGTNLELFGCLENVSVCRVCLKFTATVGAYLYETPYCVVPDSFVLKMLQYCNLRLVHLRNTSRPVLCHVCWQRVQAVYAFWKNCNTVCDRVEYYCRLVDKLDLDQNDLDDIVVMWDNLLHKPDSEECTSNIVPVVHKNYLSDHNYSKRYIDDNSDTSESSDTLTATSSLNELSPPSSPKIVDTPGRNDDSSLNRSSEPVTAFSFEDNEDNLPSSFLVQSADKDILTSSNLKTKKPGRPPGRKNRIQISSGMQTKNKTLNSGTKSEGSSLQLHTDLLIKKSPAIEDEDDRFVEEPHDLPINNYFQEKSSSICVNGETHHSGDGDPLQLEWQENCGYNLQTPTIQEVFSVADDSSLVPHKISPYQCEENVTEPVLKFTPLDTSAQWMMPSRSKQEALIFHIEPFLSDDEFLSPVPSKSAIPYSEMKEVYVYLEKCDLAVLSQSKKDETLPKSSTKAVSSVPPYPEQKLPLRRKVKRKPKRINILRKKHLRKNVNTILQSTVKNISQTGLSEKEHTVSKVDDILSKLVDEALSTGILDNVPPLVEETAVKVTQIHQLKCDSCDYYGSKPVDLKRHKLLRHWTNATKLDCSQCHKRKISASIVCLKCDRQFHPWCMAAQQSFDTNNSCTHLAAGCIVLTKLCLIISEKSDPHDVNEPKSCTYCEQPLTNYLGCDICGHYSHYKCIYDKAIEGHPVCSHLPSLFRKISMDLPKENAVKMCDHCKLVIDYPIPCPKCLTFMHQKCFAETFTPQCDHRDVLGYSPASEGGIKLVEKTFCDFCSKPVITPSSCAKCLKRMHSACFMTDSKLMQFGCEHLCLVKKL